MNDLSHYIIDTNGDGIPDDIQAVILIGEEAGSHPDLAFWSALFDLAAMAGLETEAITLPLVRQSVSPDSPHQQIVVNAVEDIHALGWQRSSGTLPETSSNETRDGCSADCLTNLFSTTGMLGDENCDLVADCTRVNFEIPERLPVSVGVALANLAARIGLESGGITLPLVRPGSNPLRVIPSTGEASFQGEDGGWVASGSEEQLALLLEKVASDWPHLTNPYMAGASFATGWLRRSLAGIGPEPHRRGELVWDMEWSSDSEIDRLAQSLMDHALPKLDTSLPVDVLIFASEPPEQRRQLARRIELDLVSGGFSESKVTVLNTFKAGLSWVREAVLPPLKPLQPARVEITYQRYESKRGPGDALDLPVRWLQELFPANEILARELRLPLDAIQITEAGADQQSTYVAKAFDRSGGELGSWECSLLSVVQPYLPAFPETGNVCVTTSGLIVKQADEELHISVDSDMQRFWQFYQHDVLQRLMQEILADGGPSIARQPFFDELIVEVWISEQNDQLGIREENVSGAEALQEDIYFNALDTLEVFGLATAGEKTDAPGAVIPIVHVVPGVAPHARVQLRPSSRTEPLEMPSVSVRSLRLHDGDFLAEVEIGTNSNERAMRERLHTLTSVDVSGSPSIQATVTLGDLSVQISLPLQEVIQPTSETTLATPPMDQNIYGDAVVQNLQHLSASPAISAWVEDTSLLGNPIPVVALSLPTGGQLRSPQKSAVFKPTCMIIARHHANEISSTNTAMQMLFLTAIDAEWADLLKRVQVVILPYENPDGADLHARLAGDPDANIWKHHPARYNAAGYEFAGDFFNESTLFGESRVRPAIWRRFLPDVIVDNHGVPSHEWVQPFAGFGSPPRFNVSYWIPQALLYGIVRYVEDPEYPEHEQAAFALRDAVSKAIRDTNIGRFNREIGASYRFWGQSREPDRFPGQFFQDMLWHLSPTTSDPEGRGFNSRFPETTVLSWVTEVNDETATGEHLERVARAHLIANRAMLDLMSSSAPAVRYRRSEVDGTVRLQIGRERPMRFSGHERS